MRAILSKFRLEITTAIAVICVLTASNARAEYRVFNLRISNQDGTQFREVLSTLDPDQYRGYHTVLPEENMKEPYQLYVQDVGMIP